MFNNNKKRWLVPILTLCMVLSPLPVKGESPALVEYTLQRAEPTSYVARRGDTLWSVGHKFGVKPTVLALANGMEPEDLLIEGQDMTIPVGEKVSYLIKSGDTLWDLARKFKTTVETLAEENVIETDENLQVGQKLVVDVSERQAENIGAMAGAEDRLSEDSLYEEESAIPALGLWPVKGVISSGFGARNGRMHEGIDVAAEYGEEIRTVADGMVVFAGDRGTYGNAVIINHGKGFRTLYAHASTLTVSAGEKVSKGQVIARVGNTGRSTGPHLHMEVLYNGVPLNPMDYLPEK